MKITKETLKQIIKEELESYSFEERVRDLYNNISSAAEETYTGFDDDDLKTFKELMMRAGIRHQ